MKKLVLFLAICWALIVPLAAQQEVFPRLAGEPTKYHLVSDWYAPGRLLSGMSPLQEQINARTPDSKTYLNADGSYFVFMSNFHYEDANGRLQEIDRTVVSDKTRQYLLKNEMNRYQSRFDYLNKKGVVVWEPGKDSLSFGLNPVASFDGLEIVGNVGVFPTVANNRVVYPSVFDGVDISYDVLATGVTHKTMFWNNTLWQGQQAAALSMSEEILLPQGAVLMANGKPVVDGAVLTQAMLAVREGDTLFAIPQAAIWDATFNTETEMAEILPTKAASNIIGLATTVHYLGNGRVRLTVAIPIEWLNHGQRTFPLTLDPTIWFTGNGSFFTSQYQYALKTNVRQRVSQMLLRASDLGYNVGNITAIAYYLGTANTYCNNSLTVKMQTTSATSISSSTMASSGWTSCFGPSTQCFTSGAPNYMDIILSSPFSYDGSSNLLIETRFVQTSSNYSSSSAGWVDAWYTSYNSHLRDNCNCTSSYPNNVANYGNQIPALRIEITPACTTPGNPHENYVNTTDAEVDWSAPSGGSPSNGYRVRYRPVGGSYSYLYPTSSVQYLSGLTPNTTYEWSVRSECGGTTSSNTSTRTFTTGGSTPPNCSDGFETNNSSGQAYSLGTSTSWSTTNACLTAGDEDWYKFYYNGAWWYFKVRGYNTSTTGAYGINFSISSTALTLETVPSGGSSTDTYLELYDNTLSLVDSDDDDGTGNFSLINYTLPTPTPTCADGYEPNNSTSQYWNLGSSSSFYATNLCLAQGGDDDYFRFVYNGNVYFIRITPFGSAYGAYGLSFSRSGNNVTIETFSVSGSNTDTKAYLYDAAGNQLADNDDYNSPFSYISTSLPVAPVANFTTTITTIGVGQTLTLSDISSGSPTSWSWSFGSGANPGTSTATNPVVQWSTPGRKTITLSVSNSIGSDQEVKTSYIKVLPNYTAVIPEPVARGNQYPKENVLDPVNPVTGGYEHQEYDLSVVGRGLDAVFSRYYFQRDATYNGSFGYGWSHSFDYWIDLADPDIRTVHHPDHLSYHVVYDGGETLGLHRGQKDSLYYSGATYTLETRSKLKFIFGQTFGNKAVLTAIQDLNGNQVVLTYNGSGQLTTIAAPGGRQLTLTYHASGKVASVTNGAYTATYSYSGAGDLASSTLGGGTMQYAYDASHRMIDVWDPNGTKFLTNQYDSQNRVTKQWDAYGKMSELIYNVGNTVVKDPYGNQQTHYYDSDLRPYKITDELGHSVEMTYSLACDLASVKDQANQTTTFTTDSRGNVTAYTSMLGFTTSVAFNALNLPISLTDALSASASLTYNAQGNLLSALLPNGSQIVRTVNTFGQELTQTLHNGAISTTTYNAYGDVATVKDALNNTWSFGYNSIGEMTSLMSPLGASWSFSYNYYGQPLTVTGPMGRTIQMQYDLNGNLTASRDKKGNWTYYFYDLKDRLIKIKDALNHEWLFTYDDLDRLKTITDARGKLVLTRNYNARGEVTSDVTKLGTTTYQYSATGNMTSFTDEAGKSHSIIHDAEGKPVSYQNPLGHVIGLSYDQLSRLKEVTMPDGTKLKTAYDAQMGWVNNVEDEAGGKNIFTRDVMGNIISIQTANGNTISQSFDLLGRIISRTEGSDMESWTYRADGLVATYTNGNGTTATFQYNAALELTGISYSTGQTETFTLDANGDIIGASNAAGAISLSLNAIGAPTSVQDVWGYTIGYETNENGDLTKITYPGGTELRYVISDSNLLRAIVLGATDTLVWYKYNAMGQRTQARYKNGVIETYTFDNAHRPVSKTISKNGVTLFTQLLTLDSNDRPTGHTETPFYMPAYPVAAGTTTTTPLTYGADDRIATPGYVHDAAGNLLADPQGNSYVYGHDFSMTGYNRNGKAVSQTFDAFGDRIKAVRNGIETRYVVERMLGLATPIEERDAAGNILAINILGEGGEVIARIQGGQMRFLHADLFGNMVLLTDAATGVVTDRYAYDDFGGYPNHVTGTSEQPFLWQGASGVMSEGDGFYFVRARMYDGKLHRFTSKDPLYDEGYTQTMNRYAYAINSPLVYGDPSGLKPQSLSYDDGLNAFQRFIISPTGDRIYNAVKWVADGKWLGTQYGQEAKDWYEDQYTQSVINGNPNNWYLVGYGISHLWTPKTWLNTANTFTIYAGGFATKLSSAAKSMRSIPALKYAAKSAMAEAGKDLTKLVGKTGILSKTGAIGKRVPALAKAVEPYLVNMSSKAGYTAKIVVGTLQTANSAIKAVTNFGKEYKTNVISAAIDVKNKVTKLLPVAQKDWNKAKSFFGKLFK